MSYEQNKKMREEFMKQVDNVRKMFVQAEALSKALGPEKPNPMLTVALSMEVAVLRSAVIASAMLLEHFVDGYIVAVEPSMREEGDVEGESLERTYDLDEVKDAKEFIEMIKAMAPPMADVEEEVEAQDGTEE